MSTPENPRPAFGAATGCATSSIGEGLYRSLDIGESSPHWHHVGPLHERISFNLIDFAGYAEPYPKTGFLRLYSMCGNDDLLPACRDFDSVESARHAGEAFFRRWVDRAGSGDVIWTAENTGVHFSAKADGAEIAHYYFCRKPFPIPGHSEGRKWHKGFRVWFGGTYYTIDFNNPDEARAKVAETWKAWMSLAKSHNQVVGRQVQDNNKSDEKPTTPAQ